TRRGPGGAFTCGSLARRSGSCRGRFAAGWPLGSGKSCRVPEGIHMSDPLVRYEQARQHAENGELELAAALFEEVLALGDVPQRAQAALGLAVVREDAGDVEGARA